MALSGCSDAPVEGSDITGTWTSSETSTSLSVVFSSDGSVTYTSNGTEYTGSWSLNGTTVDLAVSYTPTGSGATVTISETYEVLSTSAGDRLALTAGSQTSGSTTYTYKNEIGRQLAKS